MFILLLLLLHTALTSYIDLSHPLNENSTKWPTEGGLPYKVTDLPYAEGSGGGEYYFIKNIAMAEHLGTHLDAPYHFNKASWAVGDIPLENLISPVVKIDVREKAATDPDYVVTVQDLRDWEDKHGLIPQGCIVLMQSGYDQYYGTSKYFGSQQIISSSDYNYTEWSQTLHFPGFSNELVVELVNGGKTVALGVDTASIDAGHVQDLKAHFTGAATNIYNLENLCCLDKIPESGATLLVLPPSAAGATGFPVRVVAAVKELRSSAGGGGAGLLALSLTVILMLTGY